eukprot:2129695-Rhodomonas_salina.2
MEAALLFMEAALMEAALLFMEAALLFMGAAWCWLAPACELSRAHLPKTLRGPRCKRRGPGRSGGIASGVEEQGCYDSIDKLCQDDSVRP